MTVWKWIVFINLFSIGVHVTIASNDVPLLLCLPGCTVYNNTLVNDTQLQQQYDPLTLDTKEDEWQEAKKVADDRRACAQLIMSRLFSSSSSSSFFDTHNDNKRILTSAEIVEILECETRLLSVRQQQKRTCHSSYRTHLQLIKQSILPAYRRESDRRPSERHELDTHSYHPMCEEKKSVEHHYYCLSLMAWKGVSTSKALSYVARWSTSKFIVTRHEQCIYYLWMKTLGESCLTRTLLLPSTVVPLIDCPPFFTFSKK